jgi:ABC-type transport system involved in multi-copper enzyme maturation permease subunit
MKFSSNPILGRELGALLRSRKVFIAEFVFLVLLSIAVYLGWPYELVKVADRAQRSEKLFQLFASVQTLLVALIAPVFSASAFTSEKESRCFEFLYVTPLKRGTILMGKLISSILVLLIVVLSSAPLASVCLILGGVSGGQVLGLYLLLLSAGVLFGLVGVGCSVHFERTYASLGTSYLIIIPVILFLVVMVHSGIHFLLRFGIVACVVTFIIGVIRFGTLRRKLLRPPEAQWGPETAGITSSGETEDWQAEYHGPLSTIFRRDRFPDRLLFPSERTDSMPDNVNPVLDRELRGESFSFGLLLVRLLIQVSIALSLLFLVFVLAGNAQYFGYFLICFLMLVGPSLGSSAISLERERKTLDLLVTTGVRAWKIIAGKLYVATRLSMVLTLILMPPLLIGLIPPERISGWMLLAMLIEVMCVAFFVNVVGVACSAIARRTVQSMVATYAVIILLFTGVHILQIFLRLFTDLPERGLEKLTAVSPFAALVKLADTVKPGFNLALAENWEGLLAWGGHLLILLAGSAGILAFVKWRFETFVRDR